MIYLKEPKLTADNYYSLGMNKKYFSASQVKSFIDCPARTMAELNGEWEPPQSDALLIGSYVDAAFEGNAAFIRFKNEHPEIINSRTGELKADFRKADQMVKKAKSDPVFMEFMRGRKQAIRTATLFGVPFKAKFDVLRNNCTKGERRIVDLKTVRDFRPVYKESQGLLNFAEAWNWPLQMALYQKIEGHDLPCYLAVITKEDPPDLAVVQIEQERMDTEMQYLAEKMEYFKAIKAGIVEPERCERCAYCRATKKIVRPLTLGEIEMEAM